MALLKKFFFSALIFIAFAIGDSIAGHEEHHRYQRKHRGEHEKDHGKPEDSGDYLRAVSNAVYKENCGSCHFAYQPELMPWGGWKKILAESSDKHFGESVSLSAEANAEVSRYLEANSAESSRSEISVKIMKSLRGKNPARITDIPYIGKKHRKIGADILRRQTVGSLSNCSACHQKAEEGNYDDRYVNIP